ncbi:hypothetical protein PL321_03860 [Caloramator sp. mosi_1]|uniref:hypothetical protein n=1 Tax=Caloramator sp. mosi_1 TaxID=3023090 RepID=UPI00235E2E56|nr:hypothetical protein [Caloramator sp. mosi_1]WDC84779.1 hypothetical protein PL321_03860 [Caloramator sp. mosi_1]
MAAEKIGLINKELKNVEYKEIDDVYSKIEELYKRLQLSQGISIKKCFTGCTDIF